MQIAPNIRSWVQSLPRTRTSRIAVFALILLALDQATKWAVLRFMGLNEEKLVVSGVFKFVHWGNTGAAWSLFSGNNFLLAIMAAVALVILFFARHHFDSHLQTSQVALGLIFGGITGNLVDRIRVHYVIDFLYFYVQYGGREIGFPAFNVADTAICTGVGLMVLLSWRRDCASRLPEP